MRVGSAQEDETSSGKVTTARSVVTIERAMSCRRTTPTHARSGTGHSSRRCADRDGLIDVLLRGPALSSATIGVRNRYKAVATKRLAFAPADPHARRLIKACSSRCGPRRRCADAVAVLGLWAADSD